MPGFDPVKDAVLNSPSDTRTPFAFAPSRGSASNSSGVEAPIPDPPKSSGGRRATDLAVLLNDTLGAPTSPLFTPHTPHPRGVQREYFPPVQALAHEPLHASLLDASRPLPGSSRPAPTVRPVSSARSSVHSLLSPSDVEPVLPSRRQITSSPLGSPALAARTIAPSPGPGAAGPSQPVRRSSGARSVADLCLPDEPGSSSAQRVSAPIPTRPGTASSSLPGRSPELSRPSTANSLFGGPASPKASPTALRPALDQPSALFRSPSVSGPPPLEQHSRSSTEAIFKSPSLHRDSPRSAPDVFKTPSPRVPKPALPPRPSSGMASTSAAPAFTNPFHPPTGRAGAIPPHPHEPSLPLRPPPSKSLPYAPRHRITPPVSVLEPLTPAEREMYENPANWEGYKRLSKRPSIIGVKRALDDVVTEGEQTQGSPPMKRTKDVARIADHYNLRKEVGKTAREESPIIQLKNFNNWVKSVLILRFAHPALAGSPNAGKHAPSVRGAKMRGASGGKVLDLGCGKGGDISKWARAPVREYVGVDIADVSVEQARDRWRTSRGGPRFDAEFAALDCFSHPLTRVLSPARLAAPFDVVSMQFCMHYAFESTAKARQMLENVSRWLRPGGVFVGTIPNADFLLEQLDKNPKGKLDFGNEVYNIRFEERERKPVFGHRYFFFLQDAVDNVPEYIVRWDNFVQMAAEYGLHPVYKADFGTFQQDHAEHAEYGPLLVRMKVLDENHETTMTQEQWEAATIYLAFAFEKRP